MRVAVVLLYALLFVGEVIWTASVPLVPEFGRRFALGELETGILLASASLAILAVAVPSGQLADRLGPRRVTLAAGVIITVSIVGQGLAPTYAALLAARALFGIGFGAFWTAGIAWLSGAVPEERRSAALAATMTLAGAGSVAGPSFAGSLVERFGIAAPFAVAAALTGLLTAGLAFAGGRVALPTGHRALRDVVRAVGDERLVIAGLVLMLVGSTASAVVNLLVPLRLDANGLSQTAIGVAFSAASAVFLLSSATMTRLGDRAATAVAGGVAALVVAAALTGLAMATATALVVALLVLRTAAMAVAYTASLPLAVAGARRSGIGEGAVIGLLNVAWSGAAVAAPVAAGALAQTAGDSAAYLAAAAVCAAGGAVLLTARIAGAGARAASVQGGRAGR
jgi:MFS family permease